MCPPHNRRLWPPSRHRHDCLPTRSYPVSRFWQGPPPYPSRSNTPWCGGGALVSNTSITFPCANKWLYNTNLHHVWSNLFWTIPDVSYAQITQTLQFHYGQYMGNYCKHKILNNTIPLLCNLCRMNQNDTCVHSPPTNTIFIFEPIDTTKKSTLL